VSAEHVVVSVADLRRGYFLARVFEKDLAQIHQEAKAEVRLNAYPDQVFEGEVESVGRQLDPAARTVLARIAVRDERGLLRVGLYGTAVVVRGESGETEPRVVVPVDAVTRVGETEAVFVAHPDGDFELHPVTLGRSAAGKVEVLSGLRPGRGRCRGGLYGEEHVAQVDLRRGGVMRALESLVAFSLRNRAIIAVATLLFVVFGVEAVQRLPIDAVPDVTNVQVQIITAAPALSPIEVEQYVSAPVERAMAGLPRLTQVRSISKYGLSVVTTVFSEGTDIYFARARVLERMREAEQAVPARYGRPEMGPVTTGLGEVFQFVVRGPEKSLMELEELLDWYIGPQLRTVPGIVEVNSFGGENKEYQVVVQPERLRGSGLSLDDVLRALERTNANAGGGYIEKNREQLVIGTSGQVTGLGDIASAVVGSTPDGTPITLANVALVQYGARLRRGAASMDGRGEVVVGVALMLLGENSRTVTAAVKAKLAEIQPTLPPGVSIEPFYDRSALVDRTIRTVAVNLAEGAVLVILVLLLLLGSWRAGLIVASTIPLAMLFALLVMRWTGASGNLMSLGAIDFGLIVDGAVIIVENSVRRLNEAWRAKGGTLSQEERIRVIDAAAAEVRGASVYGGIIIAVVYVPILALQGIEGSCSTRWRGPSSLRSRARSSRP
jgi:cobalt-zinc-cadmium resistance protein CzcA